MSWLHTVFLDWQDGPLTWRHRLQELQQKWRRQQQRQEEEEEQAMARQRKR
jgi:hypothetical protein